MKRKLFWVTLFILISYNVMASPLRKGSFENINHQFSIYECTDTSCDDWTIDHYEQADPRPKIKYNALNTASIHRAKIWWFEYTFTLQEKFPLSFLLAGLGEFCEIYINGEMVFNRGDYKKELTTKQGPIEIVPINNSYLQLGENKVVFKSNKLVSGDFTYLAIGDHKSIVNRYSWLVFLQSLTAGFLLLFVLLSLIITSFLPEFKIYLYGTAFELATFIFVVGFTSFVFNYINSYFAYLVTTYIMAGLLVIINVDVAYRLVNIQNKTIVVIRYVIMAIACILILPIFMEYFLTGDIYYWSISFYTAWNLFAAIVQILVIIYFIYGIKTKTILDRDLGIIFALMNASFWGMMLYFLNVLILGFYMFEMILIFTVLICVVIIRKIINEYVVYKQATERSILSEKFNCLTNKENEILKQFYLVYLKHKESKYARTIGKETGDTDTTIQRHLSRIRNKLKIDSDEYLYQLKHKYIRYKQITGLDNA